MAGTAKDRSGLTHFNQLRPPAHVANEKKNFAAFFTGGEVLPPGERKLELGALFNEEMY